MHQISAPTGDTTAADALDTQLSAYGQRAARRRRKAGAAEVLGYTAAAGGLAFAGGDALGAIVHQTTGTSFTASDASAFHAWDVDGAGGTMSVYLDAGSPGQASAAMNPGPVATATSSGWVKALAKDFVVGPTLASGTFAIGTAFAYFYAGKYFPSFQVFLDKTAYFGFRFQGQTGTVGTQYGWAKARFETFNTGGIASRLIISEWAYDDEGCAIAVGATSGGGNCGGSVPTPTTALLTLLGLGALGVQTYRRRREEGLKRLAAEQEGAAA
jgi:hypothetical protein